MRRSVCSVFALLLAGVAGCGELSNAPFRHGTVRGRLTESEPAVALVAVMGAPELLTAVAAEGHFSLSQVPAGQAELLVVATPDKALRLPVEVPGGDSAELGDVEPHLAAFLHLRVRAPGRQRVAQGQVSLRGTPWSKLELGLEGLLRIGPLPAGCYELEISVSPFPTTPAQVCLSEGESRELRVMLLPSEDPLVNHGCSSRGCEQGSRCATDGQCVECLDSTHCTPNFTCINSRCEGPGAPCTPCDGDWKCRAGTSCEELPAEGSVCLSACDKGELCPPGLTCQGGLCLPSVALGSCRAYREVGTPCSEAAQCRERGLLEGLCINNACTLTCSVSTDCPEAFTCSDSAHGRICR